MLNKFIHKDIKNRLKFRNTEFNLNINKYIIKNARIDALLKKKIFLKKLMPIKKIGKTFLVNHCIITGRDRGVFRKFKLSRVTLKNFIETGSLYGIKKTSW